MKPPQSQRKIDWHGEQVEELMRQSAEQIGQEVVAPQLVVKDDPFPCNLPAQQKNDSSLEQCFKQIGVGSGLSAQYFVIDNVLLYNLTMAKNWSFLRL